MLSCKAPVPATGRTPAFHEPCRLNRYPSATPSSSVKQTGTFPAFTSSGLSGALSAEDRTNQRIKFELKKAEPAEQQEVDE
ncbi:AvrE-family type 3 secretion system effector, partial [Erwinia amylovora]